MTTEEVALPDVSHVDVVDAKQMVRGVLRDRRSKLTAKDVENFAPVFADTILDFAADAKTISLYVSVKNEPDTLLAIAALHERGVRILLPKLGPGLARMWAEYTSDDLVVEAPGRPPSPRGEALPSEAVEEADVIIVPALAVNHRGSRIGQGGGWYDRMLKQNVTSKVGALIYPWEFMDRPLPHDEQDVPIPFVLLPGETIQIGR
ncbi:5-formyltetrahydrofolate cyclo-ligase [Flaviflexus equikiangi]|uniref:5-formyltetrahydrofolate cyclo-ligase n=1 Tax=Flaviflexus equikiangi TaxID=2758573 RepID=A0ABS2TDQ9_9ACTO|nr:5-formyltetrahydrofolate cyclo-ligase [Flaviflexus equikiangi]MBM9432483.1 5-formyltetrahydrofolate cyclo-ligase [Flaviflexus equikiangi]